MIPMIRMIYPFGSRYIPMMGSPIIYSVCLVYHKLSKHAALYSYNILINGLSSDVAQYSHKIPIK